MTLTRHDIISVCIAVDCTVVEHVLVQRLMCRSIGYLISRQYNRKHKTEVTNHFVAVFTADSGVVVFSYGAALLLHSLALFALLMCHACSEYVETFAHCDITVGRLAYRFFVGLLRSGSSIAVVGQWRRRWRRRGRTSIGRKIITNWSRVTIDLTTKDIGTRDAQKNDTFV
jgi:hypothetical protein